jgi:hypothetical protein
MLIHITRPFLEINPETDNSDKRHFVAFSASPGKYPYSKPALKEATTITFKPLTLSQFITGFLSHRAL